jgi:hypothetical protein
LPARKLPQPGCKLPELLTLNRRAGGQREGGAFSWLGQMVDDVLENLFQTVIHGQSGEARSLIVGLFALGVSGMVSFRISRRRP